MDPNSPVGTPREYDVWLAPDWSDWDESTKKGRDWTRVRVRETLYTDGRRATEVLDTGGKPVSTLQESIDKDQEQRFQRGQNDAKPPGGLPTRTINGQVFGWNPSTRAYDIPTGQAPAATPAQTAAPGGAPFKDDGPETRENGRRWGWNDQTRLYDRDLGPSPTAQEIIRNSSLPADQDPRAETDAERAARGKETAARQEREAKEARANQPGEKRESVNVGGKAYTRVTTVNPQTNKSETYYEDASGARVAAPGESKPDAFAPGSTAEPQMNPADVVNGLQQYSTWLAGQVKLHRDTNGAQGISPADATAKMDQRVKLADATMRQQQQNTATATTLRSQDITDRGTTLQDTSGRRTAANTAYSTTMTNMLPMLRYLRPGDEKVFVGALNEQLNNARGYNASWGGLRETPPVGYGGFQGLDAIRQAGQAGIQTAAQGGPRIFDPQNPGMTAPPSAAPPSLPPNAAEVEAARQSTMATNQAALGAAATPPPVPTTPPPAVNPISTAPIPAPNIAPVPHPDETTTDPQTRYGAPTFDPANPPALTGAPESVLSAPPPGASIVPQSPAADPWTPPPPQPGDPTWETYRPVPGQVAPPDPAFPQGTGLDPMTEMTHYSTPYAPQSQMAPRFLQQARYGQSFDPQQAAAALQQRLGIDPEIMRMALAG